MKDFMVTVAFANGTFQHIQNGKAENEKYMIQKVLDDPFNKETIVSITVLPKQER